MVDLPAGDGYVEDGHVFVDLANPFTIVPDPEPCTRPNAQGVPTEYFEKWLVGVWSSSDNMDGLLVSPRSAATFPIVQAGIIEFEDYTWDAFPFATMPDVWSTDWAPWGHTEDAFPYYHDGVNFKYEVVPVPGAVLLGVIGLSYAGWRLRRKTT
jgi:hypothetical protein